MDSWIKGLPYQGNKAQKAGQIVSLLPSGDKLIDLMGGGGSITLLASQSSKWKTVQYNEGNPDIYQLFDEFYFKKPNIDLKAFAIPSRERFFHALKKKERTLEDNLILTCWSFSNNRTDFLYGKKKENLKLAISQAIMFGNSHTDWDDYYHPDLSTIGDKDKAYHKDIRRNFTDRRTIDQLRRLVHLEYLKRIEDILEKLPVNNVFMTNLDYKSVKIRENDVIYIDPPYFNTTNHYENVKFDEDEFIDWYTNACPAKEIYISEYSILPNTKVVEDLGKKHAVTAVGKRRNELLLKVKK